MYIPVYGNRHGGVRSAAVAEACNSRGSKVGWDVLGCYPHLVSEKTENNINCRSCRRDLYLEINIADLRKVFVCTVTYILYIYIYI